MTGIKGKVVKEGDRKYIFSNEDLSMAEKYDISVHDKDDYWENDFIDSMVDFLDNHTGVDTADPKNDKILQQLKKLAKECIPKIRVIVNSIKPSGKDLKKLHVRKEYYENGNIKWFINDKLLIQKKVPEEGMKNYLSVHRKTILHLRISFDHPEMTSEKFDVTASTKALMLKKKYDI